MTADTDLVVTGGAGGAGADLEEVDRAVCRLRSSASALWEAGGDLQRGSHLLDGLAGVPADPGGSLALEADLVGVAAALDASAALSRALAEAVVACATTYRTGEEALRHRWSALGGLLGGITGPLNGWLVTQALVPVSTLWAADPPGSAQGAAAPPGVPVTGVPGQGAVLGPPSGAGASTAQCVPVRLPVTADPQLSLPPGSPLPVFPGAVGPTTSAGSPPAESDVDWMTRAGRVVGDQEQPVVALLAGMLAGPAALVTAPAPLLALRAARSGAAKGIGASTSTVVVPSALPPGAATAPPPSGVGAAIRRVGEVNSAPGPQGRIRVERTVHADGSTTAVVYVPGVQDWGGGSPNPASFDAAVRGVAGVPSAYTEAVAQAMDEAGVEPGEPVMLAGHSLGGIVATQLAADPSFRARFDLQAVLTAGSPVGQLDVPSDVPSLHLEHREDIVPSADGLANTPLKADQVTVTAPTPEGFSAHDSDGYAVLGDRVDASDDPSLVAYREATAKFFASADDTTSTEATEWVARRVGP